MTFVTRLATIEKSYGLRFGHRRTVAAARGSTRTMEVCDMRSSSSSLHRRLALGAAIGLTALTLVLSPAAAPQSALATTSAGQNDPAWDFGRGGAEVPGQPACYVPSGNDTNRKMYSLSRPSCFPGHMQ